MDSYLPPFLFWLALNLTHKNFKSDLCFQDGSSELQLPIKRHWLRSSAYDYSKLRRKETRFQQELDKSNTGYQEVCVPYRGLHNKSPFNPLKGIQIILNKTKYTSDHFKGCRSLDLDQHSQLIWALQKNVEQVLHGCQKLIWREGQIKQLFRTLSGHANAQAGAELLDDEERLSDFAALLIDQKFAPGLFQPTLKELNRILIPR